MNDEEFLESLLRPSPIRHRIRRRTMTMIKFPRQARMDIKYFIQRGRRGWSDQDAWNFDDYLANVLVGGLARLRDNHGHPSGLCDCGDDHMHTYCNGQERWVAILSEMIIGFEAANDPWSCDVDPEEREALLHRSLDLMKKHWFSLWG